MAGQPTHSHQADQSMARRNYAILAVSFFVMLLIMYLVMFAMIYSLGEFVQNVNFFYMALMMATPMTAMMPMMMPSMYPSRMLNLAIYGLSALLFVGALAAIRAQAMVGDSQFLRSMIPHHSGAILMCKKAQLADEEVRRLCAQIIRSQSEEIDQMQAIRKRI